MAAPKRFANLKGKLAKKGDSATAAAFHEVKHNPPKQLAKTRRKFGKADARKQAVAIALNKARKAGAKIAKR